MRGLAVVGGISSYSSRQHGNHFISRYGRGLELELPLRMGSPATWAAHVPFAFWLVDAIWPAALVELGVRSGNSYCSFLQAVRALGLQSRCFGVDSGSGEGQATADGRDVHEELRAYHDPRYGEFSTLLRCSFDDALSYFPDRSIDLLHLRDSQTYEAVVRDFEAWLPKMSVRGVVLLHDTNVRERDFGVWRLWQEIVARFPTFEFYHSHGLGVAYVGSAEPPDQLRALLDTEADSPLASDARAYFSRLGAGLTDKGLLREAATRTAALQAELQVKTADTQQAMDQLDAARRTIAELQNEATLVKRLRKVLLQRYAAILAREQQVRTEIEIMKSSMSWQLTKPLRASSQSHPRLASRLKGLARPLLRRFSRRAP